MGDAAGNNFLSMFGPECSVFWIRTVPHNALRQLLSQAQLTNVFARRTKQDAIAVTAQGVFRYPGSYRGCRWLCLELSLAGNEN